VTPHPDVASGRFQQAKFAADLNQVHQVGAAKYRGMRYSAAPTWPMGSGIS
jgi:hypothetical protein